MIEMKIDTSQVSKYLVFLAEDQIPFAAARALTWTALDAQKELKRQLPQQFILRNKWTEQGIRITPANKKNLESSVYFKDRYMTKQEEGGTLLPHGNHLAIPASSRGGTHVTTVRNTRGHIKRGMRPKELLINPKVYFIGVVKDTYGVWKRTGPDKTKGGYPKPHVNLMYYLVPKGRINEVWEFFDMVSKVARNRMDRNFAISMTEALRTAK